MKKLSESLDEAIFENDHSASYSCINEAFNSKLIQQIQKSDPEDWKELTSSLRYSSISGVAWDKITDDDLIETKEPKEIKNAMKNRSIILFVGSYGDKPLRAICSGENILNSVVAYGTSGRRKPLYTSKTSLLREAKKGALTAVIVKNTENFGVRELVDKRWLSKKDAEQFKTAESILIDNRHRYRRYVSNIKLLKTYEENKHEFDEILDNASTLTKRLSSFVDTTTRTVRWFDLKNVLQMYGTLCSKLEAFTKSLKEAEKVQQAEPKDRGDVYVRQIGVMDIKDKESITAIRSYISHVNAALNQIEQDQKENEK